MYKEIYCYRFKPEANVAHDEDGNPAEAYLAVTETYTRDRLTDEEYLTNHIAYAAGLATRFMTVFENVVPIGYAEYRENVDDDE